MKSLYVSALAPKGTKATILKVYEGRFILVRITTKQVLAGASTHNQLVLHCINQFYQLIGS